MRTIIFTLFLVLLASCGGKQREFASVEEARTYANDNDNGFIETVESNDHVFSAKVNPMQKTDDALSINLRISRIDGQSVLKHQVLSPAEISEMEMYLSFDFIKDVYLRVDGKDVRPLLHHYERNYKLKPAVDIALTFPKITPTSNVQLVYRDEVFGTGLHELEFDKQAFEPFTLK